MAASHAIEFGWHGLAGRTQSGHSSLLGQLGRLHADDLQEARGEPVHARTGRAPEGVLGDAAEACQAVTGVLGLIHQFGRRWQQEHAERSCLFT